LACQVRDRTTLTKGGLEAAPFAATLSCTATGQNLPARRQDERWQSAPGTPTMIGGWRQWPPAAF